MADVLNIANAVAAELSEYNAEVLFCPEYELRDLEEMKVCVVPLAVQYKTLSRTTHEEVLKVQIGFLKRADEDDLMLKRLGVERVLVSGTQYPNCIRATVNDALSLDYAVSVITDACSAKTEAVAAANILDMRNLGAECITFAEWESRQR